ncbi:Uncharacterized protein APZ42_026959 [Daphnia magna]|uniref:Uncharacterized protein n=1 Tax=Daphnia magna TaxID=35525 RepID=A0A164RTW5_9CRUS|nr:Uncharacterized protein APZ42_026959 [Daphnia magna]
MAEKILLGTRCDRRAKVDRKMRRTLFGISTPFKMEPKLLMMNPASPEASMNDSNSCGSGSGGTQCSPPASITAEDVGS